VGAGVGVAGRCDGNRSIAQASLLVRARELIGLTDIVRLSNRLLGSLLSLI
jgi:hypothetical protein